jgi:hypothetical protein
MPRPPLPLQLPHPAGSSAATGGPILRRSRGRRRRQQRRWLQAGKGLLLGLLGIGILAGLVRIPDRLDTLLLVSQAIANLIAGLNRLALGLLQLGALLLVVLMALLALLLLAGGLVRLWRALLPAAARPRPRESGSAPVPPLL